MRTFMVGLLLAVGCGGGGGGGLEGEMSKFKDKMCACDNKECADKVHEDYNAWAKGAREEEKKLSKEEREKLKGMDREVKECRRKFRDEDKKNAADPAGSAAAPAAPAGSAATP